MSEIAILEAFTDLPDPRRTAGQRHEKALCIYSIALGKPQSWIIALTANALETDRQICLDVGMNDFITKPLNIPDITRALSAYLEKSGGQYPPPC